ncbi:MAG TPA: hypothetical protein VIY48_02885, partial [Candidatus Paceibacterota bacterium]
ALATVFSVSQTGAVSAPSVSVTDVTTTNVNGRVYPRIASGQATFNFSATSQVDVPISFPAGLFSSTPMVTVTLSSLPATSSALIVRSNSTSTTGSTLRCNDVGGANRTLTITADWIAVQT